ncbi:hypothetical protein LJY25_17355 [Hymenobacter sp. BT175]|uniref:hypothetical protein n=1 Tax=Hymenobacter translucens TaxID=2886507 RepID=UPI001D0DEFF5|nr:hypothetical protein [Hymenobacter translucens]MCC2548221.1 hypothetical protein [Hymenobacter translucens]
MPLLVHLADANDAARILRGGIKIGKGSPGVYFMPLTPDFYASHQWLRELRRGGARSFVGIQFRLPDDEEVWFGKYGTRHCKGALGAAIGEFMQLGDKLGYEFLIERRIEPGEIRKVVALPQVVGWRYSPDSHQRETLCACPMCISRGEIRSRIKRDRLEPPVPAPRYAELLDRLRAGETESVAGELLALIGSRPQRHDPRVLQFLLDQNNRNLALGLALALPAFRHPNTFGMLAGLCTHPDPAIREYSAEGLLEVDEAKGLTFLQALPPDAVITQVLKGHKD